jgi:hypothetical protein
MRAFGEHEAVVGLLLEKGAGMECRSNGLSDAALVGCKEGT